MTGLDLPSFDDSQRVECSHAVVAGAGARAVAKANGSGRRARAILAAEAQKNATLTNHLVVCAIVRACKIASQDWQKT